MKINKSNPLHWMYLFISSIIIFFAYLLRPLPLGKRDTILLYGHKLNGNLLSLYLKKTAIEEYGFCLFFLTMDYNYYKQLKQHHANVLLMTSPFSIKHLVKAAAIVSDHGLHSLSLLLDRTDIKFFDVWHGIPFKGFDQYDFLTQHKYNEVWVSSEHLKNLYLSKFGFSPEKVITTGYGRTDPLLKNASSDVVDTYELRRQFQLPTDNRKIILFAPTWKQDDEHRSELPFGISIEELLQRFCNICISTNSIFVIRAHLNSSLNNLNDSEHIFIRSHANHPDAESLLTLTDLLICDWSSIAFDFLVLDRPTIFLDVPPPFSKGFSLGPEFRFGKICKNIEDLCQATTSFLNSDQEYKNKFSNAHQNVKEKVYGNTLDGLSSTRYIERLVSNLDKPSRRKRQASDFIGQ